VVAAAALVAGCAQTGYNASKLQTELERAGATPTQARCVTNALENTFAPNLLGSHADPDAPELATARALLAKCGVKSQPR
jgi:hypothetical protein